MKRFAIAAAATLLLFDMCRAQGPVFRAPELLTYAYEDLSDLLRMYPGMYPLDYGTLGAPVVFRPWRLQPWAYAVDHDGVPQTRRYDGMYDSNLQPVSELDSLRLDYLRGSGAGTFYLTTRALPVDSPLTELQIREGFYGYGTVDFAHGQRVYRNTTLEITGRLGWYNGRRTAQPDSGFERTASASRFNRLRARVGFDLGSLWRGELTYAGSRVDAEFIANPAGNYAEREEGIFRIAPTSAANGGLAPALTIFLRQDRDKWESAFRAREAAGGYVVAARLPLPYQRLTFRQSTTAAEINFPGLDRRRELIVGVSATDSFQFKPVQVTAWAGLKRESGWRHAAETDHVLLTDVGTRAVFFAPWNLQPHGGVNYSESAVPIAWRAGSYRLASRPLVLAPEFTHTARIYMPATDKYAPLIDRYVKTAAGVRWTKRGSTVDVGAMHIARPGKHQSFFTLESDSIRLAYGSALQSRDELGLTGMMRVPLRYGLQLESQWFEQFAAAELSQRTERRGFSRLYFEREFFRSPLTIRSHVSHEHIGRRWAFSDRGQGYLNAANVWGIRISATIRGVSLIWGTENLFKQRYQLLPGYWMIGKEEYLAFQWRLML